MLRNVPVFGGYDGRVSTLQNPPRRSHVTIGAEALFSDLSPHTKPGTPNELGRLETLLLGGALP